MHKDVTFAAVFDLFLDSLSASVEKLETASRCCSKSRGKKKKRFRPGQLPETNCASKPPSASAVKSYITRENKKMTIKIVRGPRIDFQ